MCVGVRGSCVCESVVCVYIHVGGSCVCAGVRGSCVWM